MPLESCMLLLDNSEYMRNGDYVPTRLEAQQDAANLLVRQKTQSHPESTVGVSAGTELLVSPTDDMGKILSALHGLPYKGSHVDICASVQVASLALKHRRNKNGAQRIVLFVGSPIGDIESRALQKAGRQLKKNNVSIDVVAMGELEENEQKLQELVNAAGADERSCHLVTIPPGVLPSDVLVSSPVVHGGDDGVAAAAAAGGGGGSGFAGGDIGGGFAEFGGVDPNMDPELAMALRVSMEEERIRQERVSQEAAEAEPSSTSGEGTQADSAAAAAAAAAGAGGAAASSGGTAAMEVDGATDAEDELLQQALAMSMNENNEPPQAKPPATDTAGGTAAAGTEHMEMDEDEDAAMQMALQMSMQPEDSAPSGAAGASKEEESASQPAAAGQQQFQDPQFVNQLLGSLPGVDPNDPAIQNALKKLNEGGSEDKDKDDDKKKESK